MCTQKQSLSTQYTYMTTQKQQLHCVPLKVNPKKNSSSITYQKRITFVKNFRYNNCKSSQ